MFCSHMVVKDTLHNFTSIPINVYPDNVPYIHFPSGDPSTWGKIGNVSHLVLRPFCMSDFIAGIAWAEAYIERNTGAWLELVLPFMPGGRQDRLNKKGDYLFTVKTIAKIINSVGFKAVHVLDPHSEVTPALLNHCKVYGVDDVFNMCWTRFPSFSAIVAPDAGSEKRAAGVAKLLNIPIVNGYKTRDISTGAITGFGHNYDSSLYGKDLLIVDVCDGGGTFIGLGNSLKEAGAEVSLYVTHGLFSKGFVALNKIFKKIYTTDSIPLQQGVGVVVLDFVETMTR